MTISSGEWESIYTAINKAKSQSELAEGAVTGHHEDGVHVFVEGFGSEPVALAAQEYDQTIYQGSTKRTIKPKPKRPEIGQRVLVARPGGSLHNPRIIGIVQEVGTWEQPSDMQIPELPPELPTGVMAIWPIATAPVGWLICDGTAIPSQHTVLIALIGANTPDMRMRVPVGLFTGDSRTDTLGEIGGNGDVMLTIEQIPSHSHPAIVNEFMLGTTVTALGSGGSGRFVASNTDPNTGTAGGGQIHNNMQPFRVVNYIIKV